MKAQYFCVECGQSILWLSNGPKFVEPNPPLRHDTVVRLVREKKLTPHCRKDGMRSVGQFVLEEPQLTLGGKECHSM